MSFLPTDSAIKVDRNLEEKLKGASFEEIKAHLANAAVEQQLVVPDRYDNSVLIPTELANAAPKRFAKAITVNGQKLIFEGESELDIERAIGHHFRAMQSAPIQETEQPARDASTGRFTSSAEPSVSQETKDSLSLQLQLGQIDIATYLERSGAVTDYLEKAGVPMEELRSAVQEKSSQRFEQSWEQATEAFLQGAGSDWPGGQENLSTANRLIVENGLMDQPSAETLAAVWAHMQKNGLAVESQEQKSHNRSVETQQRIGEATSFEEIRQAGSSLFGR